MLAVPQQKKRLHGDEPEEREDVPMGKALVGHLVLGGVQFDIMANSYTERTALRVMKDTRAKMVAVAQASSDDPDLVTISFLTDLRPGVGGTVTCESVLAQVTRTELYFSLLPAAVRSVVDRHILLNAWRVGGTLKPVDDITGRDANRMRRIASATGEDLLLSWLHSDHNGTTTDVVSLESGSQIGTLGGMPIALISPNDQVVTRLNHSYQALYDLQGKQHRMWKTKTLYGVSGEGLMLKADGIFSVATSEKVYNVPAGLVPNEHRIEEPLWAIFGSTGSKRLFIHWPESRPSKGAVWDLHTGTCVFTLAPDPNEWILHGSQWKVLLKQQLALVVAVKSGSDANTWLLYSLQDGSLLARLPCSNRDTVIASGDRLWLPGAHPVSYFDLSTKSLHEFSLPNVSYMHCLDESTVLNVSTEGGDRSLYDLTTGAFFCGSTDDFGARVYMISLSDPTHSPRLLLEAKLKQFTDRQVRFLPPQRSVYGPVVCLGDKVWHIPSHAPA